MQPPFKKNTKHPILWNSVACGTEEYPPGKPYWIHNKTRDKTDRIVLQYTLRGKVTFRTPEGDTPVLKDQLFFFRHGDDSSYGKVKKSDDYACRWLTMEGLGLAGHYEAFRAENGSVIDLGADNPIFEQITKLCSMIESPTRTFPTIMANTTYRLMTSFFAQAETGFNNSLSPTTVAIHQLASSPCHPWNIKELAAHCGCSREYLSRKFSAIYGMSPRKFLHEKQTERALYLLEFTALPIADVAKQCGFFSTAALKKQVTLQTNMPPMKYRRLKSRQHPVETPPKDSQGTTSSS